jgi:hypothetical protein
MAGHRLCGLRNRSPLLLGGNNCVSDCMMSGGVDDAHKRAAAVWSWGGCLPIVGSYL